MRLRLVKYSVLTFCLPALVMAARTTAPTSSPTVDLYTGTSPGLSAADAVDVVREGTHFVSRTAVLTHTPDHQQAMLSFDNNGAPTNSPPMIVLPNLNLFMMEAVTADKTARVEFRISGSVTEYKAHNYILIDSVQTALRQHAVTAPVAVTREKTPPPPPPAVELIPATSVSPPVNNLMGDAAREKMNHLLAPLPDSGEPLTLTYDNTSPPPAAASPTAVSPNAPAMKLLREGTHLIDRVGRLNHSPDGKQAFFTFDADGKAMQDPPLLILPNLKLAQMEGAVTGKASDVHFRISGTITEYRGRNGILLNKAIAIADPEVPF